jgi:CRISPR-associated protein Cas1
MRHHGKASPTPATHDRIKGYLFVDESNVMTLPVAALAVIFLGPGTSVTHAAMKVAAEHGCSVVWTGSEQSRFYAQGMGETRRSARTLKQALLWANPESRTAVVRRMYEIRFEETPNSSLTIQQIRGKEGVRVRDSYARASREFGVPWNGREYERGNWKSADPVNRALSAANSILYGLCHSAIVSAGYSTAIGFVHTGKMLSFVYDVADFYKAEITIPLAFVAASASAISPEREVRRKYREAITEARLLKRIVPDIAKVLDVPKELAAGTFDMESALPGWLWDEGGWVEGGHNYGSNHSGEGAGEAEGGVVHVDVGTQAGSLCGDDDVHS